MYVCSMYIFNLFFIFFLIGTPTMYLYCTRVHGTSTSKKKKKMYVRIQLAVHSSTGMVKSTRDK